MALTAADLKFFASSVMADSADGGGGRSATLVQNGVQNNVFPDVSGSDRSLGRVHLRKIYPSLTNADLAPLLGGSAAINQVPTDAAVDVLLFAFGDAATTREQALVAVRTGSSRVNSALANFATGTASSGSDTITGTTISDLYEGDFCLVGPTAPSNHGVLEGQRFVFRRVVSLGSSIQFDAALPFTGTVRAQRITSFPDGVIRYFGACAVPAGVATSAVALTVASPFGRLVGLSESLVVPSTVEGIGSLADWLVTPRPFDLATSLGRVPIVKAGDLATLWHETATAAATASNGGTVNVGRTDLDQLAIVGANGVEILRFMANGPSPGATATVNLSTGVVTFVNVSGWSQPVTVRHRIAHRSAVETVVGATVTLATAPARDFPAGSVLSTHLPLGDVYARAFGAFSQQAWTRVWSDTLIGNPVTAMYAGMPAVSNGGADTDRWACVFTAANEFIVYSERLGRIGSGNTALNYSPINPATGAPFFTLSAAAWASGLLVGSVYRFNTQGAAPPIWLLRSVAPSSATGSGLVALRLHGSVDA